MPFYDVNVLAVRVFVDPLSATPLVAAVKLHVGDAVSHLAAARVDCDTREVFN
jgi:hypothetical protein